MGQLLDAALAFRRAGLSVLPCRLPNKAPAHDLLPRVHDRPTWDPLKKALAPEKEIQSWFHQESATLAVGVIGGAVSGNLEIIDFDDIEAFPKWAALVKATDPTLMKRLVAESTLRGGCHVFYRCEEPIPGNLKLARARRTDAKTGSEVQKTLIETRGEGGYVVVAPSQGYTAKYRTPDQVEMLTVEQRNILIQAARSLNEIAEAFQEPPPPPTRGGRQSEDQKPGDAFNQDFAMLRTLLQSNGWALVHTHGGAEYWRRPGKDKGGISATWNHIPGRFHVFSSNAHPLESEKTYSPFSLYAFMECGGDFASAASKLRSIGYGVKDPLAHVRPEEPPPPDDSYLPPVRTRGNLAVVPELEPPQSRRITREDPDWEPGMDDEDEEPDRTPPQTDATVSELPRPPEGMQHIMDQTVIELALAGERGLGSLAAMLFKDRLLFDHGMKRWYRWGKHHWEECLCSEELEEIRLLQMLIQSTAVRRRPKKLPGKDDDHRKKGDGGALFESLMTAADSLRKLLTTTHVLDFAAAGDNGLGITGKEWDQNAQWLLPVKNGVVDLRTGELRPGHPSDRLKTIAPTEYDPEAKAPRFDQFIHEIMPSPDVARFLKLLLGYGLTGSVSEHVFPVFWGQEGRNGKDTLIEAIHSVMGPMASSVPAKSLMAQQFSPDHDSTMMDLRGRRIVWASESNERQALDAAKVKLWTGGGTLTGRPPYGSRQISFEPTHKLFLISNYKPKINADDSAMWRRMVLIPFEISFIDNPTKANQKKVDKNLPQALRAEQKGILRWLVEGCLEWQKVGLVLPKEVTQANASYQSEEDTIGSFLQDCLVVEAGSKTSAKDMYAKFVAWAETNNMGKPLGAKMFTKALRNKGFEGNHGRAGTVFCGLRLVEADL